MYKNAALRGKHRRSSGFSTAKSMTHGTQQTKCCGCCGVAVAPAKPIINLSNPPLASKHLRSLLSPSLLPPPLPPSSFLIFHPTPFSLDHDTSPPSNSSIPSIFQFSHVYAPASPVPSVPLHSTHNPHLPPSFRPHSSSAYHCTPPSSSSLSPYSPHTTRTIPSPRCTVNFFPMAFLFVQLT